MPVVFMPRDRICCSYESHLIIRRARMLRPRRSYRIEENATTVRRLIEVDQHTACRPLGIRYRDTTRTRACRASLTSQPSGARVLVKQPVRRIRGARRVSVPDATPTALAARGMVMSVTDVRR